MPAPGACYSSVVIESISIEPRPHGAALLALAADPVRYQVLTILARQEHCVCELQDMVEVPLNLLSYHLRALRDAGLVSCAKQGRRRDYRLEPGAMERLAAALPGAKAGRVGAERRREREAAGRLG